MKKTTLCTLLLISFSVFAHAQIRMKKKGKTKDISGFAVLSGGMAMPTQHFASVYGDYYYHNASGFAKRGTIETIEAGLNFPQENCEVSVKTNYCTSPFDMDAYVQNQKEPPTQIYSHPGGPGVNYAAISSGEYKYVSCLLKAESEYAVKKFSFGLFTGIGTSKFLSYPDVKIAMDSASNHVMVGTAQTDLVVRGFSPKKNNYGISLNYGITASYHFTSHVFVKMTCDYVYSHFVFNSNHTTAIENGSVWSTRTDLEKYALPVTTINFSLGLGIRF